MRPFSEKVADQLVGATEDLIERCRPLVRVELGIREQAAQLGDRRERCDEVAELGEDRLEPLLFLRCLEERPCVQAGGNGH